ncbi:MAG TPA: hypothetical protein VGA40_10925 [Candidatus Acidoferrales bacterium]
MANYDPTTALEELREDAVLPHPVRLRDMMLRARLEPDTAREMSIEFQSYLHNFGEAQKAAARILERIAAAGPESH